MAVEDVFMYQTAGDNDDEDEDDSVSVSNVSTASIDEGMPSLLQNEISLCGY